MIPSRRMALQYVLLFGANGVSLPFAGLWFRAQGFSGAEIGALLAAPMLARVVTGPVLAVWADGFRERRTPIALLGAMAALAYLGAGLTQGVFIQGGLWFLGATAMAAMIPLTDVLNLTAAQRHRFAFASPRGWGSAAFVAANVLMGAILARAAVDWVIVWIVAAGALIAVTAAGLLPPEPVSDAGPSRKRDRYAGIAKLAADPGFMTAIVAIGAVQATHGFYYGFSAIAWKAQGISETMTGLLWAMSVVVEIGFMWVIEPWRRARGIGPWALLMVGGVAAVVRWSLLAVTPPLWALWPLQGLHALTFAATYLGGVEIVERLAPAGQHTAAQTLNSVMASGVLIGLATLSAGPLYDRFGTLGYLSMTGLALVGLIAGWRLKGVLAVS
ncbi:MFS transporter [Brevundimonas sp. LM2]|uniref:MFS transporter n=1 Tax=Brevundimonas sp. LM2 TaxID=1938605 RepID=UPI000983EA1D|nr:MFS transporter [Brevundimonas sp. LM2]AQR61601.1 MFS transporter [Brevundimonas sp. LM2]